MKSKYLIALLIFSCFLSSEEFYDINQINIIELFFIQSNWDEILDDSYSVGNEERLVGTALINGVQYDSVGVRYKGYSSYSANQTKNPFNIKLDYIIEDQKIQDNGTIKLSNGYRDPSFVREVLSYEIARNYMAASKANYAKVFVNDQYIGLYINVQDVDKQFGINHFSPLHDVRFKAEFADHGLHNSTIWGYLGNDPSNYFEYYEKESPLGWFHLMNFLYNFNYHSNQLDEYLDIDTHLWMLAFENLIVNLDSPINYGHNYYLFYDVSNRFIPVIWDLNMSFGGFTNLSDGTQLTFDDMKNLEPLLHISNPDFPIIRKVLSNDTYKKMYIDHIRTIIEDFFINGNYEIRADEIQDIIDAEYLNDPNKFYTYEEYRRNVNFPIFGNWLEPNSIIGITQLMDERSDWLLNHDLFQGNIPEFLSQSYSPTQVEPEMLIWINVEFIDADEVWIYYRTSENTRFIASQMFDDGNHNDVNAGDGIYGISLQTGFDDFQYYFYAQNDEQGKFYPTKASNEFLEIDIQSNLENIIINEINYNSSYDFDPGDWIEFYNRSCTAVDISGWKFMDEDDSHCFVIPDNTIINSGTYRVLCRSFITFENCFPNVYNLIGEIDFGLSGDGELIRLYDASDNLIDWVEYDDRIPWPYLPDGYGNTLELIDSSYDNSEAVSWQASQEYGTPGTENSCYLIGSNSIINSSKIELTNHPNPFNPYTTISFDLPAKDAKNTRIEIYNLKGQKVKTIPVILSGFERSVVWNGDDESGKPVSSGIYYYMLNINGKTEAIKKCLLLK